MRIKGAFVLFLVGLMSFLTKANEQADSLLLQLRKAKHDTTKIRINNELSAIFTKTNPDTAYFFVNRAISISQKYLTSDENDLAVIVKKHSANSHTLLGNYYKALGNYEKAINSYKKSINRRQELNDFKGVANNYIDIGIITSNKGNYSSAEDYYKKAVDIQQKINDKPGLAKAYRNIGNVYYYQGDYELAIENYQKSLEISEKINDLAGVSRCYNNIGFIHTETKHYNWALEYYNKSLVIKEQIGDKRGIATIDNNMGNVYYAQKKYPKAIEFYKKSLAIREEVKDKRGMAFSLRNIGRVFSTEKNYATADSFYQQSLQINREIEDQEQISLLLTEIASIYLNLEKYYEAIKYAEQSISIGKELNTLPRLRDGYELLAKAYEKQNNIHKAFKYYKLFIIMQDSIYSREEHKIIEQETRFREERQQAEIEKQELEIKKQEADEKNLKMQMYILLLGFAAMIIFAIVMFRNYKQKTRANKLLEEQKREIQKAKEEIESQRDLVIEKNKIVIAQKTEIEDSIIYAKNIQEAILPSNDLRLEILPEHFIFFRPRNIVSGDFFWIKKVKNFIVVAIADCTGHGVPGAFMSMLGFMFLNETVTTRSLDNAGQILDKLRDKIKRSLHQSGKEGEAKDGMDISFFIIDSESRELQFSGAFNPLYIIRENNKIKDRQKIDNEKIKVYQSKDKFIGATLFEIKGDRQPISIYMYEKEFSNHVFQLEKGDKVYSFTDGYPDQFGGEEGKKFNARRFKEFLLNIRNHPMKKQEELITNNFYEWMGEIEQVDDVLLMGVEID